MSKRTKWHPYDGINFSRSSQPERCLLMIKPEIPPYYGPIFEALEKANLRVTEVFSCMFSRKIAEEFYGHLRDRPEIFSSVVELLSKGPVVVIIVEGDNVFMKVNEIVGPTNPKDCRKDQLRSIYAKLYPDIVQLPNNAIHRSANKQEFGEQLALLNELIRISLDSELRKYI